jgi:hypothetical protein
LLLDAPRHPCRLLAAAALVLLPAIGHAQDSSVPLGAWPASLFETRAPATPARGNALDEVTADWSAMSPAVEQTGTRDRGVLLPLYASFATLQALDAHSTVRAIRAGGEEANPLLRGVADRPAALYALKAGVTASTIFLAEKLRVRNRTGAIVLMAALNSAYAVVVAHNYNAVR